MTGPTPAEPDYTALAVELQAMRAYLIRNTDLSALDRDAEALRRLLTGAGTQWVTRAEHERTVRGYQSLATEERESHERRLGEEITRADANRARIAAELASHLADTAHQQAGKYRIQGWCAAGQELIRIAQHGGSDGAR